MRLGRVCGKRVKFKFAGEGVYFYLSNKYGIVYQKDNNRKQLYQIDNSRQGIDCDKGKQQ